MRRLFWIVPALGTAACFPAFPDESPDAGPDAPTLEAAADTATWDAGVETSVPETGPDVSDVAAEPPPDSASAESGWDAPEEDASSPPDAPPDVADAAPCTAACVLEGDGSVACAPDASNLCPTFCNGQTAPPGVAASDYACVDFDTGLPPSTTWAPSQTKSGTLALSSTLAFTSPMSLLSSVPATADFSNDATGTLTWTAAGATPVKAISASVEVNPLTIGGVPAAWTGSDKALCVTFNSSNSWVCVEFLINSSRVASWQVAYTYFNGGAVENTCAMTGSWTAGTWNALSLSVTGNGAITATLNGTSTMCGTGASPATETSASVSVGLASIATTASSWSSYYDNVVAYVTR